MENLKVLVVDDAGFMRKLITKKLEESNFEVVGTAKNAKEAISKYFELSPHLVTMDLVLEEEAGMYKTKYTGLVASQQILKKDPKAKIIAVSGSNDPELQSKASEIGVVDYILKPFQPSQLTSTLNKVYAYEEKVANEESKKEISSKEVIEKEDSKSNDDYKEKIEEKKSIYEKRREKIFKKNEENEITDLTFDLSNEDDYEDLELADIRTLINELKEEIKRTDLESKKARLRDTIEKLEKRKITADEYIEENKFDPLNPLGKISSSTDAIEKAKTINEVEQIKKDSKKEKNSIKKLLGKLF